MYYIEDRDQLAIEAFTMPFGGKLDPKNRWVRLAGIMPWDQIEEIYLRTMSTETGRRVTWNSLWKSIELVGRAQYELSRFTELWQGRRTLLKGTHVMAMMNAASVRAAAALKI